ncbi:MULTISPECIES: hypothetical protein [Metallosphaera]|uniref:hypothetical protein n=1 Tax=Metallosphaera TaxID=41980 RepID=UPI001F0602CF|nr:hypothetical protein [Metallosphaera sedula]MCH1771041.1 hypothetical protein [Metallosphaera sedula]MCP6729398.1 hypothetical protein [Metallosphaera sedula]
MPKKPKLNVTLYDSIRRGSLALILFATFLGMSVESASSSLYFLPLIISYVMLFLFGWLNRKSFSSLGEKFNLSVRLYPVLIAGLVLGFVSSVLVEIRIDQQIFSIIEFVGILLILSYLFEYSLEMVRLSDDFGSKGLKIASGIVAISIPIYLIIGAIPFAILVTAGGMYAYVEMTKIVNLYKRDA